MRTQEFYCLDKNEYMHEQTTIEFCGDKVPERVYAVWVCKPVITSAKDMTKAFQGFVAAYLTDD